MSVVVFTGPSLDPDEAYGRLVGAGTADVDVRSPAAHGDVLRATLDGVDVIAIIDGVFDRLPAVWHKEILYALTSGIAVYGAASMGALRASELDHFGMRGVGEIYQAFASGELEDDDEVAVRHADASEGFRNLSDPMVDVRATMRAAVVAGATDGATADELIAAVKARFYADRLLLEHLGEPKHRELRQWVRSHRVHQKRADALTLLDVIAAGEHDPPTPTWTLQHTQYWEAAYRRVAGEQRGDGDGSIIGESETDRLGHLLDESRLDPTRHRDVENRALVTLLSAAATRHADASPTDDLVGAALREHYAAHDITDQAALDDWLERRALDHTDLAWLSQRWSQRRSARRAVERALPAEIVRELRESGEFAALRARADRKRQTVTADRSGSPPGAETLLSWYFVDLLDQAIPGSIELWAKHHGWRDGTDLVRALDREWRFRSDSE